VHSPASGSLRCSAISAVCCMISVMSWLIGVWRSITSLPFVLARANAAPSIYALYKMFERVLCLLEFGRRQSRLGRGRTECVDAGVECDQAFVGVALEREEFSEHAEHALQQRMVVCERAGELGAQLCEPWEHGRADCGVEAVRVRAVDGSQEAASVDKTKRGAERDTWGQRRRWRHAGMYGGRVHGSGGEVKGRCDHVRSRPSGLK
jgi:hypothetical protein